MNPADKSDAERIAALEAEINVLREWIAVLSQEARTTYPAHLPGIYPQPFTPNPWPYSPFTWGTLRSTT